MPHMNEGGVLPPNMPPLPQGNVVDVAWGSFRLKVGGTVIWLVWMLLQAM